MNTYHHSPSDPPEVQQALTRLAEPSVGGLLADLEVGYDGTCCARVGQVDRFFAVDERSLHPGEALVLIKIRATEQHRQRRRDNPDRYPVSIPGLLTLHVMARLAPQGLVGVTGLRPEGRAFWDRMQAKGWIERLDDEHDPRRRQVLLTPAGLEVLEVYAPPMPTQAGGPEELARGRIMSWMRGWSVRGRRRDG